MKIQSKNSNIILEINNNNYEVNTENIIHYNDHKGHQFIKYNGKDYYVINIIDENNKTKYILSERKLILG